MSKLDETFATTTKILFGRPLSPMARYTQWLLKRIAPIESVPSAIGSGKVHIPAYSFFGFIPKTRAVSEEHAPEAGARMVNELGESATLASLLPELKKMAFFVPTFAERRNLGVENTVCYLDCVNVENSFDPFETKHSAFVFQTLRCENIYGCYYAISTNFCIHCYNAVNLQRCFEVDTGKNCVDSMFCHNVEGLQDCLFCFNVKNKRFAIGNVEVGREKYLQIKQQLLEKIGRELEANAEVSFDIYSVLGGTQNPKPETKNSNPAGRI